MNAEDELQALVAQRMHDLEEALEPFTRHMSSDECITVQLRNEWIARARKLLAPRCDGNHAAPACADPQCWQTEAQSRFQRASARMQAEPPKLRCYFTRGDGIEDHLLVTSAADAERQISPDRIRRYEEIG